MAETQTGRMAQSVGDTDVGVERIVAFIIDSIIGGVIFGVFFVLAIIFGGVVGGSVGSLIGVLMYLVGAVASFLYKIYFEANGGQPFGKQFMDIKVIKEDGSDCDFVAAIIRNILLIVDNLPFAYILGLVMMFAVSDKNQRIGDIAASTVVVKT